MLLTSRDSLTSSLLLCAAFSAACSGSPAAVDESLERRDQAVWTRDAKGDAEQHDDAPLVARNTVVRIPTKNLTPGKPDTACTGVLLTPSLVLTSKFCLDPTKGTATPDIQVGPSTSALTKRTVQTITSMPASPSLAGLDGGDLVIIKLALPATTKEAYLAASDRPTLAAPVLTAGVANPSPPGGNRELPKIELVGWSPFAIDSKGESIAPTYAATRQFAQQESAYLYWLTADNNAPFFVREVYALLRPGTAKLGLHTGDVGSPLYYYDSTTSTKRQLIGLATALGMTTTPDDHGIVIAERAAPSAIPGTHCDQSRCDVWIDLTSPAAKKFIEDNAVQSAGGNWLKFHRRADGLPTYWYGESDVQTESCETGNALDTDCDGWLNVNAALADNAVFKARDNCPYTFNPDQLDSDDDSVGDLCETVPPGCTPSYDADCDNIAIWYDNCPIKANADQIDVDRDGIGDACDECNDVVDLAWNDQKCAPSCTSMATTNESTGTTLYGTGSRYSPDGYGSRGCPNQWIMEFFPSSAPNSFTLSQLVPRLKRQDYTTASLDPSEAYNINPATLCTGSSVTAEVWARRISDKQWVQIQTFSSGFNWSPSSSCPANTLCPENCRVANIPSLYRFPLAVPASTYDRARMFGAVKAKWQTKTLVQDSPGPLTITFGSL